MPNKIEKGDPPAAYLDGWTAHKNNVPRTRSPYNVATQFASHELWTEGWLARKYSLDKDQPTALWDDYAPRYDL